VLSTALTSLNRQNTDQPKQFAEPSESAPICSKRARRYQESQWHKLIKLFLQTKSYLQRAPNAARRCRLGGSPPAGSIAIWARLDVRRAALQEPKRSSSARHLMQLDKEQKAHGSTQKQEFRSVSQKMKTSRQKHSRERV
jgi:hypothetical protein